MPTDTEESVKGLVDIWDKQYVAELTTPAFFPPHSGLFGPDLTYFLGIVDVLVMDVPSFLFLSIFDNYNSLALPTHSGY